MFPSSETDDFKQCHSNKKSITYTNFCERRFLTELEKLTCKNDMCFLCCDVTDAMKNKNHSYETVMKCKSNCLSYHKKIN